MRDLKDDAWTLTETDIDALEIGAGRGDGHKRLIDKNEFSLRTALGGYEADNAVTAAQIGYLDRARQAGNMLQEQASSVV